MSTASRSRWAVQGATFGLWALALASAVSWGLRLSARPDPAVAVTGGRASIEPDPAGIGRLLGSSPQAGPVAAAPVASRLSLLGVATQGGTAVALIEVEGKPARPYRVGAVVDDGLVLQAVQGRRALLGPTAQGPATVTLELPQARPDTVTTPPPVQPPAAVMQPPGAGFPVRPGVGLPGQATPGQPVQPGAGFPVRPGESPQRGLPAAPR